MMELMPVNCWSNMRAMDRSRGLRTEPLINSLGLICCDPLFRLALSRSNSTEMSVCLYGRELKKKLTALA